MKALLNSTFILLGFTTSAYADEMYVADIRRNITLAEDDPVYKDFYINTQGKNLKKNLVVTAMRKINIRDASGANAVGEITVPVGQLRVIAIYDRVAVAREYKLLSRDELPMLEQIGIMTGDQIDLAGSFVDSKRKPSSIPPEAPVSGAKSPTQAPVPVESAQPELPAPLQTLLPATKVEVLEKTAVSGTNLTP